jgi:crotonobetainyl-CoA:carnitine CoA-transferase CaiB-like acyl-CoA transferase
LAGVDVPIGDVPALGAHSRKILRELGYPPEAIDDLVRRHVTTLA